MLPKPGPFDAGPHLHPMTVVDLFYWLADHYSDILEQWNTDRHTAWQYNDRSTPHAYHHPAHLRPVLLDPFPPLHEPPPHSDPRQLCLDLLDDDIPF